MLTLWDLIDPLLNKLVTQPRTRGGERSAAPRGKPGAATTGSKSPVGARVEAESANDASPGIGMAPPLTPRGSRSKKRGRGADKSPDAGMQAKYDAVVKHMLAEHGVRVRKWRKNMSGIAWYVTYRDGSVQRLVEAPRPKGPMSAAIFLHEIGHHAIGFNVYKPRCLEEFHAWRWSLEAMEAHGLNITDQVRLRMHRSLHYAVQKAVRRGIKQIPAELGPFLEKPPSRRRSSGGSGR